MKIVLIGYVWPEPTSSAAGLRTLQLLRAFQRAGHEVHVLSASVPNTFAEKLNDAGFSTQPIQVNDSRFDEQIRTLQPDIVIFDRFITEEQFGWRVRARCPEAMRIIDTQDLHFLRRARETALREGASLADIAHLRFELQTEDAHREIAAMYRSDLTFVLSDFEYKALVEHFDVPEEALMLSRFHYPAPKPSPAFEERAHFVWIGNFRHPPNADALRWTREGVWPAVRKRLPRAEFHVYGAYPPKEFMDLNDEAQGFRVLGPCDDAYRMLSKYRVLLAPLRYGAGIKGKITDAWSVGTPVVTTPIGAEGMHENLPWGGKVAETPNELAQAAVDLHESSKTWQEGSEAGKHVLNELFHEAKLETALLRRIENARSSLKERRRRNFVGQILWHQGLRSTEYFSRWIEAKNQFTLKS